MDNSVLEYLKTQRVGVLAVEMLDGAPHAATVHFAHTENPLVFYFETYRDSRKAQAVVKNTITRASLVIGMSESEMKTLQLDGEVRLITDNDIIENIYLAKFPNKKTKLEADPSKFIFFSFTPTWWRFTDWTKPKGKQIVTSTN